VSQIKTLCIYEENPTAQAQYEIFEGNIGSPIKVVGLYEIILAGIFKIR